MCLVSLSAILLQNKEQPLQYLCFLKITLVKTDSSLAKVLISGSGAIAIHSRLVLCHIINVT